MPNQPFVRVDCDFGAHGLWDERGAALRPDHLGLSPALSLALEAWQLHYDATALTDLLFDETDHDRIGRAIAKLVKAERPDLKIVYAGDEPYPGETARFARESAESAIP